MAKRQRKQTGFSLIELLVTVTVILIIAAIAVPNYMSSRMAANEGSAVASLRTISTALVIYTTNYPLVGYAPDLVSLGDGGSTANCAPNVIAVPTSACLIDTALSHDPVNKNGFQITYSPDASQVPSGTYTIHADPTSRGVTGRRSFFTDQPGVIRWNATAAATATDPPIPM